ncbi:MAG: TIGR03620 family F420-dependent LLM class oxidoreductase [Mycobacteriales bacterium]|jgi:probable F420-dependent oxidoreductase
MDTAVVDAYRERLGRVGVWLGSRAIVSVTAAEERAAVAEIEELGYGSLWIGAGGMGKDELTHAAVLLAAARRLVVATGISPIWGREAFNTAGGAGLLADAYPGRFVLGLGVSHAPQVTARGIDYHRPYRAMVTYLDRMDAAGYPGPPPAEPAPRVLAALRPRMLELARDRAEGAHPYFTPVEHTALAREVLGPGPLLVPEVAVMLETDPDTARAAARRYMANPYLQLPNYLNNLREFGYTDDDFRDGGSDRLADAIVGWGDVDAVRARIEAHLAAGADHVVVQPIGAGLSGALAQLRELAPAVVRSV